MPTFKLRKLRITKVDLCKAGANPDADILIYKSMDEPVVTTPITHQEDTSVPQKLTKVDLTKATPEEAKAYAEALEKSLLDTEAELEKAKKPTPPKPKDPVEPDADDAVMKSLPEPIRKRLEEAEAIAKAADARATAAEKVAEKATTDVAKARQESEFVTIQKMVEQDMPKVPGTVAEVAKMLQEAKETLTAPSYVVLEKALKAGSAALAKSEVEIGSNKPAAGSAIEEINKMADEEVAKGTSKTRPEAITKVAKAHPDLYKRYKDEKNTR